MTQFFSCVLATLVVVAGLVRSAGAAEPDALYRLVDRDAALCMEFHDLERALPAFWQSPWMARIEQQPLYQGWRNSGDYQKLEAARTEIARVAGKPVETLVADLFGKSVLLVLTPANNKEAQTIGLLLTRTRSAEVLQAAVEAWNTAERQETKPREHAGLGYFVRIKAADNSKLYYATLGDTFVLSSDEASVQQTLARHAAPLDQPSLLKDQNFLQALAELPNTPVRVYINPRRWDEAMHLKEAAAGSDPFGRAIAAGWKACRSLTLGLHLDHGPVLEASLRYDSAESAALWQEFVSRTQGSAEFLPLVPADALVAFAGRTNFQWVEGVLKALVKPNQPGWKQFRQVAKGLCLGQDPITQLLPQFEANWGMYLIPGLRNADDAAPVDALIAWQIPHLELSPLAKPAEGKPSEFRKAIDNALQAGLNFWAVARNSELDAETVVRSEDSTATTIRWLDHVGPYRPAYALTSNYLVLATSREAIDQFTQPSAAGMATTLAYQKLAKRYFPEANQQLLVNVLQARNLLQQRRPQLVRYVSSLNRLTPEQNERRLTRLEELLQILDGGFIAGHLGPDRVRIVVGAVVDGDARTER